jgi:hypothetical protein
VRTRMGACFCCGFRFSDLGIFQHAVIAVAKDVLIFAPPSRARITEPPNLMHSPSLRTYH